MPYAEFHVGSTASAFKTQIQAQPAAALPSIIVAKILVRRSLAACPGFAENFR
jgi:hypothetical protein